MTSFSRRHFMKLSFGAAASAMLPLPKLAWGAPGTRELALYNLHTGEKLRLAFYENGQYIPSAMEAMNQLLRDFRTGDVHPMDPALFDQLHALQQRVDKPGAFHVISGYRSPETNRKLHNNSGGVANKSLHMQGRAIDVRLPGKEISQMHKAALSMQAGGVGYYPASGFIHLDTGRVRRWG